jgi:hypothetical protein
MLPLPLVFQREEEGSNSKVCVMSFSRFERFLDRISPPSAADLPISADRRRAPRGALFRRAAIESTANLIQKRIAIHRKSLSRHRSDKCYLSIVHIGQGDRNPGAEPKTRNQVMSIRMNRILDVLASYAIVALGLTLAGATAIVGA